jgi:hypothetical protein
MENRNFGMEYRNYGMEYRNSGMEYVEKKYGKMSHVWFILTKFINFN